MMAGDIQLPKVYIYIYSIINNLQELIGVKRGVLEPFGILPVVPNVVLVQYP
jgi:hypothetical protein